VTDNGRGKLSVSAVFFVPAQVGLNPLVPKLCSSISPLFFPLFNLFAKEVKAQRTGILVTVDILAVNLIALHEQLIAWFTTEGGLVF
jgi:hypothetical protein